MHLSLFAVSDVDGIDLNWEMGGQGLISSERCIRMEENNFRWFVRNSVEPLTEGVKAAETIEYNVNENENEKEFKQAWMRQKVRILEKQKDVWIVCTRNGRNKR